MSISCEKDPNLTTLEIVKFASPIEASPSTIVLATTNLTKSVTTISWPDVNYPINAPVNYTLEFDLEANTLGETAWKNSIKIIAGEEVLSKSFSGLEINDIATTLGLMPDVVGKIAVRVVSYMDRPAYSQPLILTVTPFTSQINYPQIYMLGGFQNWDFATAATLLAISPGVFQGYITFPSNRSLEFKFTRYLNYSQSYGANASGNFTEGGANNLTVPGYNTYLITVNLNTLSFTAVPYSWGIIGTATPGGWDNDTDMYYDYQNFVWKYNGSLVAGAVKFRLNNTWTINYGPAGNPSGPTTIGTVLLDNPGAHTIITPGNYVITYTHNPAIPATATYTVTQL